MAAQYQAAAGNERNINGWPISAKAYMAAYGGAQLKWQLAMAKKRNGNINNGAENNGVSIMAAQRKRNGVWQ